MKATLSSKGQIVLPVELRQQDQIVPGQQFEIKRIKEGEYLLRKLDAPTLSVFKWLQACPEKDWFCPIASHRTDDL